MPKKADRLPEVVFPGPDGQDVSRRDHVLAEVRAWQERMAPSMTRNGVFIPSLEYTLMSDLLGLLFAAESKAKRGRAVTGGRR